MLLVEDDRDIRDATLEVLEHEEFQAFTAPDGVEALRALSQVPRPRMLLLDLMMPMLDGERFLDFHERLPERDQFPVVIISALSYGDSLRSRPGVLAVLRKPFEIEDLLQVLQAFRIRVKGESS